MAVDDWISNLFQSEQTRGLSGGLSASITLDESNPFYNYRLRRHQVAGDIIGAPLSIWTGNEAQDEGGGLEEHLKTSLGQGVAEFTDVLLILSLEDYSRAADAADEPWPQMASQVLLERFEIFCRQENFSRRFVHRPLSLRILCDGSADMGGQSLGLSAGEFVTGLLPNLYTGPVQGSHPVLAVYVNLPGVWEGYQEVGRLYSDQVLYTIGNSWLDNFSHPSLKEGALYRLNRNSDGSFVHVVSPDLQDQYQVIPQEQGEHSVMTLATRDGEPIAHLLLALLEGADMAKQSAATVPPGQPQPMAISEADFLQSVSVIPNSPQDRIFSLQERGVLLQRVHFSNFMLGYNVYLGIHGELGTNVENKAATFQVRKRQVSLVAHIEGVHVGEHPVAVGEEFPIEGDVIIDANGQKLEYKDLRGLRVERWPYVGEIRRPASSNYMMWGNDYLLGRSRDCRVVLPDEPENSNIVWKPSVGDGAVIRSRTGDIPKARFYTDSIMVGSEHAAIQLKTPDPVVISKNKSCFVYVRRGAAVFPLYPTASGKEPTEMSLQPADEVLVGNCLFHVGFTPVEEGASVAPAPAVTLALQGEDATEKMSEEEAAHLADLTPPTPHDIAHAQGLGQGGAAPEPLFLAETGPDSILGEFYEDDEEMDERPVDAPLSSPDAEEPVAFDEEQTLPGTPAPIASPAQVAFDDDALDLYEDEEDYDDASVAEEPDIEPSIEEDAFDLDFGEEEPLWSGPVDEEFVVEMTPGDPLPVIQADADDNAIEDVEGLVELEEGVQEPVSSVEEASQNAQAVEDEAPAEIPAAPPAEPPVEIPVPSDVLEESAASNSEESESLGTVVFVDDAEAQFELGREMQLILVGWVVNGTVTFGNHSGSTLVLPENRIVPEQQFRAVDYFQLKIRGRKGHLKILEPSELRMDGAVPPQSDYPNPEGVVLDILRRDDAGDEDFSVRVEIIEDPSLPNPRARLLALDVQDELAAALVTRGLPKRSERRLELSGMAMSFTYTGEAVHIHDYLDDYKTDNGYNPFFIQRGESRFVTAPEDGALIELVPGDHIIVGDVLYSLQKS